MEMRMEELVMLRSYTENIDKDLTMILQSLQWDRKHILQHPTLVTCKYDTNHRVLLERAEEHERECILRHYGYTKQDKLLPDPLDTESSTLIKLSKEDISQIIDNASKSDPTFKRGVGSEELAPRTLARLQTTFSGDERRAIYDAVVSASPACHDLTDLALVSVGEDDKPPKSKSRTEILAELRDMRRRRTKYRVAVKSTNYSDVLRDVIKTQMEIYNEALGDRKPDIQEFKSSDQRADSEHNTRHKEDRQRPEHRREVSTDTHKKERTDRDDRNSKDSRRRGSSRDRRYDDRDRRHRNPSGDTKTEDLKRHDKDRDRSRESRHRHRTYDERSDTNTKYKDRLEIKQEKPEKYVERPRRSYEEYCRRNEKDRYSSREKYDGKAELSDAERARNLIVEIKKEVESDKSHRNEVSRYDRGEENGESRERKSRDDRAHRDKHNRRDRVEYKRHKHGSREERGDDREIKRMRIEDKHKIYSEVYSELDKRRNRNDDTNK